MWEASWDGGRRKMWTHSLHSWLMKTRWFTAAWCLAIRSTSWMVFGGPSIRLTPTLFPKGSRNPTVLYTIRSFPSRRTVESLYSMISCYNVYHHEPALSFSCSLIFCIETEQLAGIGSGIYNHRNAIVGIYPACISFFLRHSLHPFSAP